MKGMIIVVLALVSGACQSTYVPASDGRVSVIDLTLYPSSYKDQTVISHGYLRWRDDSAALLFDGSHITRRATRFAIDMDISPGMTDRAAGCAGQEVLVKGVVRERENGWVLAEVEDFVC